MSKQYLVLCDELGMTVMKNLFRSEAVQFLEVQGMNLNAENQYNLLVTPVISPVNPVVAKEAPIQTTPEEEIPDHLIDNA